MGFGIYNKYMWMKIGGYFNFFSKIYGSCFLRYFEIDIVLYVDLIRVRVF